MTLSSKRKFCCEAKEVAEDIEDDLDRETISTTSEKTESIAESGEDEEDSIDRQGVWQGGDPECSLMAVDMLVQPGRGGGQRYMLALEF